MKRNCLFIPLEEIISHFKENTRQDIKIVAPEILSEQMFNILTKKGKNLKKEKPLRGEQWVHSEKNEPNSICESADFVEIEIPKFENGPFAVSFANENAEQDYHYHERHWEIYFSEHPIGAQYKTMSEFQYKNVNLNKGGALIFGPEVIHKMKMHGLTLIIECPSLAQDKKIAN